MAVKNKVGRPKTKDKKVVWAFTIEKSKKDAALKVGEKKFFDDYFREKISFTINT